MTFELELKGRNIYLASERTVSQAEKTRCSERASCNIEKKGLGKDETEELG